MNVQASIESRLSFDLLEPYVNIDCSFSTKADPIAHTGDAVSLDQVHGNRTIVTRSPIPRTEKADGAITDVPNLLLTIRVADCQSFVIFHPTKHILGLLHAGWRGLVRGAIPEFFDALNAEWPDIDPSTLLVCAGPSLCTKCAGFTDPSMELPNIDPRFFHGKHVDLRGIADQQFFDAGIQKQHLERHPDCTRCHPELFWTYRGGDKKDVVEGRTNVLAAMLV